MTVLYSGQTLSKREIFSSSWTKKLIKRQIKAVGKSQKDKLFIRGKAISGAPIIMGTNQLPKPPIRAGMTIKKIMIRPCIDTKTRY